MPLAIRKVISYMLHFSFNFFLCTSFFKILIYPHGIYASLFSQVQFLVNFLIQTTIISMNMPKLVTGNYKFIVINTYVDDNKNHKLHIALHCYSTDVY